MSKSSKAPLPLPESFNLPCTGVESHAHLNGKLFTDDLEEVIARAKASGISRIGQVFLSSNDWEEGKKLFLHHPEFFFILGIHPTDAELLTDEEYEKLCHLMKTEERIKAVGEIGLDYYWKDVPPETQKKIFVRQLHMAGELRLPIVIHSRDATEDTINILTAEGFSNYPLLWHCFGGDSVLAERILNLGWHISIPGPVTYPANHALREAVKIIPLNRMMVETDCPYLTPMPYRGKRNEPAYLAFTIQLMAEARQMDVAEIWAACGKTALDFFQLPQI